MMGRYGDRLSSYFVRRTICDVAVQSFCLWFADATEESVPW